MNETPRWQHWHSWTVLFVILWGAGCWLASCTPQRPFLVTEQPPLLAEDALTDVNADERPRTRIPAKPLPWQKTPPCDAEMGESAISGACYVPVGGRTPPCGRLIEHSGACYRAIAKPQRQPTSVEP